MQLLRISGSWDRLQSVGLWLLEANISVQFIQFPARGEGAFFFQPKGDLTFAIEKMAARADLSRKVIMATATLPTQPLTLRHITIPVPQNPKPFNLTRKRKPIQPNTLYRIPDSSDGLFAQFLDHLQHPYQRREFANGCALYTWLPTTAYNSIHAHGFTRVAVRGIPNEENKD